ncbi:sigma-70 family RNA polymerase sigma factor [Micromonospora sp. CPCC 205558]|uniref:sigma-70 family RNA polymerase sigma factor n=1 Tax=Micromonospora sp. CPCC 205558 TaxID=3122403 RepID=UPI002FF24B4A
MFELASNVGTAFADDDSGADGASDTMRPQARMRRVYVGNAEPLRRFLLRLCWGDQQLAEDLLQETMLQAWRHIDRLPNNRESIRRWLFIVARRIAIDAARARQARPAEIIVTDLAWYAGTIDVTEDVVTAQTVRSALPKLTAAHRSVLIQLYFFGRSTDEAAAMLGIPEGTVKSRAHYALQALRAAIGRTDGD